MKICEDSRTEIRGRSKICDDKYRYEEVRDEEMRWRDLRTKKCTTKKPWTKIRPETVILTVMNGAWDFFVVFVKILTDSICIRGFSMYLFWRATDTFYANPDFDSVICLENYVEKTYWEGTFVFLSSSISISGECLFQLQTQKVFNCALCLTELCLTVNCI